MKSIWKVSTIPCGVDTYYQVYRILDIGKTDHSGNREYKDKMYTIKAEAQELADKLNLQCVKE